MGKIIIDRENNFSGCLAKFYIYLNGKKIGYINNGQVKELDIPNGKHTLLLRNIIDVSNTINIEIDNYTTIYILCKMGAFSPKISIKSINKNGSSNLKYEELKSLQNLREKGIITEEEFNKEKLKILN